MSHGHHYSLRSVPSDVWQGARKRAYAEKLSMRFVIIRALELYASRRIDLR